MNIIAGILDTEIALAIPGTCSFAKNRFKWHYFFKKFHIFVRTVGKRRQAFLNLFSDRPEFAIFLPYFTHDPRPYPVARDKYPVGVYII